MTGPYYHHHQSYFHKPTGPEGENYLEGLICWLSHAQESSYLPILKELQECLGKETLPLTRWADHEEATPPPLFLLQNFPLWQEWAECRGFKWHLPELLPEPQLQYKLLAWLIDLSLHSYGAPPSLLTHMEDYNPYIAATTGSMR